MFFMDVGLQTNGELTQKQKLQPADMKMEKIMYLLPSLRYFPINFHQLLVQVL